MLWARNSVKLNFRLSFSLYSLPVPIACSNKSFFFFNCDGVLQIHRRYSKLPPQKQKVELLLQIVQIPKRRTYQYIHGLDISFNCITLTNLCQPTLFSFLKFSTVHIILWFNQSCNIRTASTDYLCSSQLWQEKVDYQLPMEIFCPKK